jgi:hypothetical protein
MNSTFYYDLFNYSTIKKGNVSTIFEVTIVILLLRVIYERSRFNGFKWRGTRTNFSYLWLRPQCWLY